MHHVSTYLYYLLLSQLNGRGEPCYARITATHTSVIASDYSSCADKANKTFTSNKIKSTPISNFAWPYCYYIGNNIAALKDSDILAYTLISKFIGLAFVTSLVAPRKSESSVFQGKVRVFDLKTSRKYLINEIYGNSLVMRFSSDSTLAIIDSFGILYIYTLIIDEASFEASKQLVLFPKVDQSPIKFVSLCWRSEGVIDPILIWSHENSLMLADVKKTLHDIDKSTSEKLTYDAVLNQLKPDVFRVTKEQNDLITMISLSKFQDILCVATLTGNVFISKFASSELAIEFVLLPILNLNLVMCANFNLMEKFRSILVSCLGSTLRISMFR
ncbi:hypothetical protein Ciccas_009089 [Cichlidogyrus casuarinus]|uniref:Enhancer of mRNA-decapping protein 4 WD40 repeat region domain-containing protein n=1 Tax=Cichlidogyrus casuarinus TaxID=1844966 RepID=A0ABD2PZ09_9PLAT